MAVTNLLLSAVAQLTDPTYIQDQIAPLSVNADGRLRASTKAGHFPDVSGNLTTAAQTLAVDVTIASNVVLHMKNTGSASTSAGAFVFEASIDSTDGIDGTWFSVQATRSGDSTIENGRGTSSLTAGSAQTYAWELSVNAYKWFRVRCSTTLTTNAIATWTIVRGAYATEPIPAIATHAVTTSGTVTNTPANPTTYSVVTAATTNGASISTSAKTLHEIAISNLTAAVIYVKLYNKNAAPVVGTDIPVITIPVAVGAFLSVEFGALGKRFAAGLAIAITGAAAATDTTATAVGAQVSLSYL